MSGRDDRFLRQREIVPQDRLAGLRVTVVGVGAIGRQVAMQLASIGVGQLQLIDLDVVECSNLTTQGYRHGEIGCTKVAACEAAIAEIDPSIQVEAICDRFRRRQTVGPVIFCCVDSINVRSNIWKTVQGKATFWCDGRMLGEVMRVLAADDQTTSDHYQRTLFAASEAHRGACTSRSTIYTAGIAAGLMVHQFTRWLRGIPIDADQTINLLSGEWTHGEILRHAGAAS